MINEDLIGCERNFITYNYDNNSSVRNKNLVEIINDNINIFNNSQSTNMIHYRINISKSK
jgi:hypothetical protein